MKQSSCTFLLPIYNIINHETIEKHKIVLHYNITIQTKIIVFIYILYHCFYTIHNMYSPITVVGTIGFMINFVVHDFNV